MTEPTTEPKPKRVKRSPQFSYHIQESLVRERSDILPELNALGAAGWELLSLEFQSLSSNQSLARGIFKKTL
jgi:hypothetical protein